MAAQQTLCNSRQYWSAITAPVALWTPRALCPIGIWSSVHISAQPDNLQWKHESYFPCLHFVLELYSSLLPHTLTNRPRMLVLTNNINLTINKR